MTWQTLKKPFANVVCSLILAYLITHSESWRSACRYNCDLVSNNRKLNSVWKSGNVRKYQSIYINITLDILPIHWIIFIKNFSPSKRRDLFISARNKKKSAIYVPDGHVNINSLFVARFLTGIHVLLCNAVEDGIATVSNWCV